VKLIPALGVFVCSCCPVLWAAAVITTHHTTCHTCIALPGLLLLPYCFIRCWASSPLWGCLTRIVHHCCLWSQLYWTSTLHGRAGVSAVMMVTRRCLAYAGCVWRMCT
jgi:hypothetical protein